MKPNLDRHAVAWVGGPSGRTGGTVWTLFPAAVIAFIAGVASAAGSELNCLIEPHVVITVTAPVNGLIESVAVDRGDLVKEGQVLAMLDSSVERAVGSVNHAQAELTNKHLASLELQRTNAEIALRTVRSPISGVVVERFMHPGEFTKQERMFKLAQLDPLRVEVFAPVALHGKVAVGMQAHVRPEAPVNGVYTAKVTVVDRVIDAASGTFGVRLQLPNAEYKLPAGLKCTVRFARE